MNLDQRGKPILRVVRGEAGAWEVQEAGFEIPLSYFDSAQAAKDYAENIAGAKPGIIVEVYNEDGRLQSTVCAAG
jgi:hypothetical protein